MVSPNLNLTCEATLVEELGRITVNFTQWYRWKALLYEQAERAFTAIILVLYKLFFCDLITIDFVSHIFLFLNLYVKILLILVHDYFNLI